MLRAAAGIAVIFLAACATVPPPIPETTVPPADWAARTAALAAVQDWTLNGRVALHNGHDAWSAGLHWTQRRDAYRVSLYGPLGQGVVQMDGDGSGGVLRLADDKTFKSSNMEDLLYRELGWHIPVDGLRFWARGLPVPDTPTHYAFDAQGRLVWLEQFGWHVAYLRYTRVDRLALPQRVDITRRKLSVKLVVDQWDVTPR